MFQSMFDYVSGKQIQSLAEIPKDCKIIVLSENEQQPAIEPENDEPVDFGKPDTNMVTISTENEKKSHTIKMSDSLMSKPGQSFITSVPQLEPSFKGIANNVYDFATSKQQRACEKGKVEETIFNSKADFFTKYRTRWAARTKAVIEERNQAMDSVYHQAP